MMQQICFEGRSDFLLGLELAITQLAGQVPLPNAPGNLVKPSTTRASPP
jgi:hypothetical protein